MTSALSKALCLVLFCAYLLYSQACDSSNDVREGDPVERCDDGTDNDGDGLFDCDDESCRNHPTCQGTDGGNGLEGDTDSEIDADGGVNDDVNPDTDAGFGDTGSSSDANRDGADETDGKGFAPYPSDYYVAGDGDDDNPGTEERPFATVQRALDAATAGDLIYLRGGNYYPTAATVFRNGGTEGAPIAVQCYPGELPVINGRDIPEGDITHASTPTWIFDDAHDFHIVGPIHVTNGRGAGVSIEGDSSDIVFERIESSYNGQRASRGAHGFFVGGASWTNAARIQFINCDAHHNANHLTKPEEEIDSNKYQHGDGWRIMSGVDIELIGCRAFYNMDDNYDFTQAVDRIVVTDCWAAYAGIDDPEGSITGNPDSFSEDGQGFKIGYDNDVAEHQLIRTVAWRNKESGYFARGGRYTIYNAVSYQNGILGISEVPRRGFYFPPESFGREHEIRNSWAFNDGANTEVVSMMKSTHNSWDEGISFSLTAEDFIGLDDTIALGPRQMNGSLPVSDFLRLSPTSDLIDSGIDVGESFNGSAPDIGAFETP